MTPALTRRPVNNALARRPVVRRRSPPPRTIHIVIPSTRQPRTSIAAPAWTPSTPEELARYDAAFDSFLNIALTGLLGFLATSLFFGMTAGAAARKHD